ncbi:hypothetical protein GOP47_0020264 [Adiantum capillus-veneris]|uniref:Uncharacterized protein n=1 Tax=Adiantum capillus-veneris TaxID=13818 RepID=A0A9D4UBX1_ADICA|nr:hypothetical protein GOP47_0019660 [Adiantum capillus-veneris]KAI5065569.1 hypothetical protein GOP47_0020264 [Adiantum capillus-veneris]
MSEDTLQIQKDENFPHNNSDMLALHLDGVVYPPITVVKSEGKAKRRSGAKQNLDTEDAFNLLHGSNPLKVELTRLENEVRDKDRELQEAQAEIKALKVTERAREKALEELDDELKKVEAKLKQTELLLENKNLEVKRINDEKKAALAAQFAAEATLRRVQAAQKDEDMPPIEVIIAPLEAELRIARQEVAKLQENNRALDRLTKSKEAALLEAEKTIQIAEVKASMVDDLQNRNQELMKQLDICQEENKILEKMQRQKIAEVEKLSTTIAELEEAVLAGGATANAVRESRQHVNLLMEEKRTLERELARAKVTANRVAVVVANEWKDANDKVMPVKQWLDERRFLQGEMQQLRDKLSIAERAAKTEAQLKEKFQLRLKVLEDSLKSSSNGSSYRISPREEGPRNVLSGPARGRSVVGTEDGLNGLNSKHLTSVPQVRGFSSSPLRNAKLNKSFDGENPSERLTSKGKSFLNGFEGLKRSSTAVSRVESNVTPEKKLDPDNEQAEKTDDTVSGLLYDMLQKEVIALRRAGHEKDQSLKDKDDAIEMLSRKVDTLTKAMDVEAKKMRREVANMEKEVVAMRVGREHETRSRRQSAAKLPSK